MLKCHKNRLFLVPKLRRFFRSKGRSTFFLGNSATARPSHFKGLLDESMLRTRFLVNGREWNTAGHAVSQQYKFTTPYVHTCRE